MPPNFRKAIERSLNYTNLRRATFPFVGAVALVADALASFFYYWAEGSLPASIHIAALSTAVLISIPIYWATLHLLKSLEEKQEALILAQEHEASSSQELKKRNLIFHSLLHTSISMQQSKELSTLLDHTLNDLNQIFPDCGFAIVIYGARETSVQNFSSIHLLAEEQTLVIEGARSLSSPYELTEKLQLVTRNAYDKKNRYNWMFAPLSGSENKKLGYLIIKQPVQTSIHHDVVSLFVDQLSVTAENRLLLLELERLANTDALTGIYNRNFFQKELDSEIAKASKNNNIPFSIFVIDINGLKRINDTYGHEEGDKLIIAVANLLKKSFRDSDVITRSGGDEFVILCPNTQCDDALGVLNRIRALEKNMTLAHYKGGNTHQIEPVHISIGVACSTETTPENVFGLADENMYEDKKRFYANNSKYR